MTLVIRSFKNRNIQVLVLLALYFLVSPYLSIGAHQGLYTVSTVIKELLMWALPCTVMFFIAHTICFFERRALLFMVVLVIFEMLSNLASVWYAFGSAHLAAKHLPPIAPGLLKSDFPPLWTLPFSRPAWWSADKGTLIGVGVGFLAAFMKNKVFANAIERGKEFAEWILTRIFSRLIPLFVLGFVAKMNKTAILEHMFVHYSTLLIYLIGFLALYLMVLFYLGSSSLLTPLKNLLPAGSLAFCSGCSISTMPWTIAGTAKNLQNPSFAQAVIPATTNIQQIGDCIANTFLCFLIYRHFYGYNPDVCTWLYFSIFFVLARFATAAIIGGAIFIMLPIYEKYLFFNAEMIAIILAFNVILDPLITSSNVIANGALCRIFEKVWLKGNALIFKTQNSIK